MKKHLTLILLIVWGHTAYSQNKYEPGFIINSSNDTLLGYIENTNPRLLAQECVFRYEGKITKYSPKDILAFGFEGGRFYVKREIFHKEEKMTVFLEYLVDGEIDLLFFRSSIGLHFFIINKSGELIELKNTETLVEINSRDYIREEKEYINTLKEAFKDTPELYPLIEKLDLNQKKLIDITSEYHKMSSEDGIEYILYGKNTEPIRRFGFSLGASFNRLKFIPKNSIYSYLNNDIATGRGFYAAIRYSSSNIFGMSERASLNTGLGYSRMSYSSEDVSFVQNGLMIPLIFEYKSAGRYSRPFVQLGLNNFLQFGNNAETIIEQRNELFIRAMEDYQLAFIVGVGIEFGASSISLNYNRITPFTGLGDMHLNFLSSEINGLEIQFNIFFRDSY